MENRNIENYRSVSERMMQLIGVSEDYIGKIARWSLRGAYLTIILCCISMVLLITMVSDPHIMHSRDLQMIFMGAILICQLILIFWWSVFIYLSKTDIRKTKDWWNQNIKPLKERDTSILFQ